MDLRFVDSSQASNELDRALTLYRFEASTKCPLRPTSRHWPNSLQRLLHFRTRAFHSALIWTTALIRMTAMTRERLD
jgi:hypothetical protein